MNKLNQERIAELKWASEREIKKSEFLTNISSIMDTNQIEILNFERSDDLMIHYDDWPGSTSDFVFQAPKNNYDSINKIIHNLANYIQGEYAFIFLMNLNFGLAKLQISEIEKHWKEIIEVVGDELFIFDPNNSHFVCVSLTEDFLPNSQHPEWIYEVTFSRMELKNKLIESSGT